VGLKYVSSDSSALMSALSANLSTAEAMVESTESATDQLVEALGGGQLSGQAYATAQAMFTEAIKPGLTKVRGVLDDARSDLDSYKQADELVSRYGDLDEDLLRKQLVSVSAQRDLTQQRIEANQALIAASTTLPGVAASVEIANARLKIVQSGLEADIQELEDKLKALKAFNSRTAGLFDTWLDEAVEFVGGYPALGGYVLGAAKDSAGVMRVRDYLDGRKWTENSQRQLLLLGGKTGYKSKTSHLTRLGKDFNAQSGVRIDHYKKPLKAGLNGARTAIVDTAGDFNFKAWKGASALTNAGRALGAAGTVLTIGSNAYERFHDGVQGNDVRDFAVDTAVDIGSAAAAAGIGAAAGSLVLPPIGTVIGAGAGLVASLLMNAKLPFFGDRSFADGAKDLIKSGLDWLQSKFW
jgi:hypothetical protein